MTRINFYVSKEEFDIIIRALEDYRRGIEMDKTNKLLEKLYPLYG